MIDGQRLANSQTLPPPYKTYFLAYSININDVRKYKDCCDDLVLPMCPKI